MDTTGVYGGSPIWWRALTLIFVRRRARQLDKISTKIERFCTHLVLNIAPSLIHQFWCTDMESNPSLFLQFFNGVFVDPLLLQEMEAPSNLAWRTQMGWKNGPGAVFWAVSGLLDKRVAAATAKPSKIPLDMSTGILFFSQNVNRPYDHCKKTYTNSL